MRVYVALCKQRSPSACPNEHKSVQCLPRHCFICQISITNHPTRLAVPFPILRPDPSRVSFFFLDGVRQLCPSPAALQPHPPAGLRHWCLQANVRLRQRWPPGRGESTTMLLWWWQTRRPLCREFIIGRKEKNVSLSESGNRCDLQSENHQTHMLLSLSQWKWLKR